MHTICLKGGQRLLKLFSDITGRCISYGGALDVVDLGLSEDVSAFLSVVR